MPKAARNKAATPNAHPLASLILSSHLKDYTFSAVRDYLRLYAAECHGLDSKAMRSKTKFVLKQLEKVGVDRILGASADGSSATSLATTTPEPSRQPQQRLTEGHDDEQETYRHLDTKPYLRQVPISSKEVPVSPMFWNHPIPYLWQPLLQKDWPTLLGRSADDVHPGEAPHRTFYGKPSLPLDHYDISAYDSRNASFVSCESIAQVVDVSPQIYSLNSVKRGGGQSPSYLKAKTAHGLLCKDASVAMIARALLGTGRFICVMPIVLADIAADIPRRHYGLVITFGSAGNVAILPLCIFFLGAEHRTQLGPSAKNKEKLRTHGQWDRNAQGLGKLWEKFEHHPILRCEDVQMPGVDIDLLARRILGVIKPVRFHGSTPSKPFDIIQLAGFDLISFTPHFINAMQEHTSDDIVDLTEIDDHAETEMESGPDQQGRAMRAILVNEIPSCSFHLECTVNPIPNSIYCLWHHRIVTKHVAVVPQDLLRQERVTFIQPMAEDTWYPLRMLRTVVRNFVVWIVDVEFVSLKDVLPVPWQIVVRDASSGKIVISSLVNYGSMSIEDMVHELLKYYKGPNPGPWCPNVPKLRKAYKGTHTTGLSLKSIGDALRDSGFHPDTHRILSWYSVLDMQVFSRALSGENRLIVSRDSQSSYQIYDRDDQASLQPVNFGLLVRNCSDLACGQLGYVHRSLFKGKNLIMHDAENDTLAMYEIYQLFLEKSQDWEIDAGRN
ncbi:unnamed protein product [Alternaria alternata]